MAIIIGSITTVSVDAGVDGFQSVSWNINRQPTRLWELGSWDPYKTQVGATLSVSLSVYAGVVNAMNLTPATSCADSSATKAIIINPAACDNTVEGVDETMYVTSYSYSKGDPTGFATESWSFQKWIDSGVGGNFIPIPVPTYVLQGRSEGSRSGNVGNGTTDLGVQFLNEPGTDHVVTGTQGSVSAGFPGIGNADETKLGLVERIGGGKLEAGGETGQSSANVPHQPLYLG